MRGKEIFQRPDPPFAHGTFASFFDMLQEREDPTKDGIRSYPRDGFFGLADLEAHAGELIGMDKKGHTLFFNSGMAAVDTILDVANLTAGDTIVHGFQGYSQIVGYCTEDLPERGIKSIPVDPSSTKDIQKAIETNRPKVVFFETVTNGTEMTVLDVEKFLDLPILKEVDPIIILDNTLPTNSILPLAEIMRRYPDLKIIGLESATKFYALNQELGGILFTYHEDILKKLAKKRRRIGSILGLSAAKTISRVIPPSKGEFDRVNRRIMRNTFELAKACFDVQRDDGRFTITYPNLPNNLNSNYANLHYPNGASPVFFIVIDPPYNHLLLAENLCNHPVIGYKDGEIILAQSFGFSKTGIVFYPFLPYLRIAGGTESPGRVRELGEAFKEVLSKFQYERETRLW